MKIKKIGEQKFDLFANSYARPDLKLASPNKNRASSKAKIMRTECKKATLKLSESLMITKCSNFMNTEIKLNFLQTKNITKKPSNRKIKCSPNS